ncbi:unnamed protein product [Sphenostylis stenocarpa]|uniref:Uncharacterized protein n=1 Tax=Sphenostylis stenocarpa TaxID=92480 RepID=A0AA86RY03_9FABA|nr:unnamed protein product [Sphenostylis stenocarpa]
MSMEMVNIVADKASQWWNGVSLEGVREGEPRVLRDIHEKQSTESLERRCKAKDPEHGLRFFQGTSLGLRRGRDVEVEITTLQ